MVKQIHVPWLGTLSMQTCYGLPSIAAAIFLGFWLTGVWSRLNPPVVYLSVHVEQVNSEDEKFVVLQVYKSVVWYRFCDGTAAQELRLKLSHGQSSITGLPLEAHTINVPPRLGPYTGTRPASILVPRGIAPPGTYQYFIRAKMKCFFWESWWPIDSEYAWAEVTIK